MQLTLFIFSILALLESDKRLRAHSIKVNNFRSFRVLEEMKLGRLATIVGQNDVGKSNILRALQIFFKSKGKPEVSDVCTNTGQEDDVIIEVAFNLLPVTIEIEDGIQTNFQEEMLVDSDGYLRIRKKYPRDNLGKYTITLITQDFQDPRFAGLASLNEKELNSRCNDAEIPATLAGRGVTNKGKREQIRAKAKEEHITWGDSELPLTQTHKLWKKIESLLPKFELFETDTRLGVEETTFQSKFRPVVNKAAEQTTVITAKEAFT